MQAGKLRVYIGILLGGIGTVQLVFVAWRTLPGILSGNLVQYATYMLQAALFVHTIIFLFFSYPIQLERRLLTPLNMKKRGIIKLSRRLRQTLGAMNND